DERPELGEEPGRDIDRPYRVLTSERRGRTRQVATTQGQRQEAAPLHRGGEPSADHVVGVLTADERTPQRGAARCQGRARYLASGWTEPAVDEVELQREAGGAHLLLHLEVRQVVRNGNFGESGS